MPQSKRRINYVGFGNLMSFALLCEGMLDVDDKEDQRLVEAFRAHVGAASFPCVGAKAAMGRGSLAILVCSDIASAWDDLRIHQKLLDWSEDYQREPALFRSLAVIFARPRDLTEEEFERHMWDRLQSLSDKDGWLGQTYDNAVSADPSDPHFGLSFGGRPISWSGCIQGRRVRHASLNDR